ncbi:hypothetical protein CEXT_731691 [Caerostris extrusa]|uniref:Uncharacterized protein n=1 Tax=Caerostris extrusa TaxID=172846 RepID=A0AAV4R4Q8_CAEEX|nr:hypothetical protein CEXT_731691 [Caerostris extrusa]
MTNESVAGASVRAPRCFIHSLTFSRNLATRLSFRQNGRIGMSSGKMYGLRRRVDIFHPAFLELPFDRSTNWRNNEWDLDHIFLL